jgi:hypothetical protein
LVRIALLMLAGCTARSHQVVVDAPPAAEDAIASFIDYTPDDGGVTLDTQGRGTKVGIVLDLNCDECWELEKTGRNYTVHAGDVRGAQYGLADLLELGGFRFHHPFDTVVLERFGDIPECALDVRHETEMSRRGLQMHMLHPIEGMYDFWMPDQGDSERAKRTIDWVVKNRGNHLQWVGLDDILDEAHIRGVTVSTGVQLFGSGNLQQAFDLL